MRLFIYNKQEVKFIKSQITTLIKPHNKQTPKYSSQILVLGIESKSLPINHLLHLFLGWGMMFKVEVKGSHAHRLVTDVVQ